MSEEKRIEELAWDLCDIPRHPSIKSCDECGNKHCHAIYYAKRAINKGYRKQIEGEWIGEGDGYADGELVYDVWHCSECNYCIDDGTDDVDLLPNFCPNCGAKMKERIAHEPRKAD